jgi:hypothetical protein
MEQIMCDLGYRNIGFPCLVCSNKILGFVITLLSMIKVCFKLRSGDILIVVPGQYYSNICWFLQLVVASHLDALFLILPFLYESG